MNSELQEIFELIPLGLKKAGRIGDREIHTNLKIQNYIKEWIENSHNLKPISKNINKGIDTGNIIIGFENPGKLNALLNRFKRIMTPTKLSGIMGFYNGKDKKLVILLDENVDFLGGAIKNIPPIITHEMMHYAANVDTKKVYSITKSKYLIPFYRNVVTNLDPKTAKITDSVLGKTITNLMNYFEKDNSLGAGIRDAYNVWNLFFDELDGSKSDLSLAMILPYFAYIREMRIKPKHTSIAKKVALSMYSSYEQLGVRNPMNLSTVGQEAIYPSEILAVINQFDLTNEGAKVINNIRMRNR